MSIRQQTTLRPSAPLVIEHEPLREPPRHAPSHEPPRDPSAPVSGPRRREDDFDVLKMAPSRYDHIDRLYRNVVLVLFAVGMAVGFWFKG